MMGLVKYIVEYSGVFFKIVVVSAVGLLEYPIEYSVVASNRFVFLELLLLVYGIVSFNAVPIGGVSVVVCSLVKWVECVIESSDR